jgi:TnpA family transposase
MKIARGRELLTPEQRQALMQIPEDEWVLGTYYTFSKRDLEIINKRRREENRLGFAVQLAVLRSRLAIHSYQKHPRFSHTLYIETNRCHSIFA